MAPLRVHTYAKCGSCRAATSWLRARGLAFTEIPIREQPPTVDELRRMLAHLDGNLRRLCNTSGTDYRALGLGERLPTMDEAEVLALLAGNGNLVKRPFLLGPGIGLVGFDAELWAARLTP